MLRILLLEEMLGSLQHEDQPLWQHLVNKSIGLITTQSPQLDVAFRAIIRSKMKATTLAWRSKVSDQWVIDQVE